MRTKTVLLIDDEDSTLLPLGRYLTSKGYIVHCARDGAEALRTASKHHPDLAIVDLVMPGLDGRAFLKERALGIALSQMPVIVITGGDFTDLPLSTTVLPKPFSPEELLEKIRQKLGE